MDHKKYYSSKGKYLAEHEEYFSNTKQFKKDINFLKNVLDLKKSDKILDLACGHGRHTIELTKLGFDIDGLDFSDHLLKIAKEQSKQENLSINFYKQDIHKINLKTKYNKIFLYFSEFGLFDADQALKNISKVLKKNGLFLLDCDNVFRLIKYLEEHPKAPYEFDFENMELYEKNQKGKGIKYFTVPELESLFQKNKLKDFTVFGDYDQKALNKNSKRIIILAKKI